MVQKTGSTSLFRTEKFVYRPSGLRTEELVEALKKFDEQVRGSLSGDVLGFGPVRGNTFSKYTSLDWFNEGENFLSELLERLRALIETTAFSPEYNPAYSHPGEDMVRRIHASFLDPARKLEAMVSKAAIGVGNELRVYIPVLRGLRPFGEGNVYETRTRKDYDLGNAKGSVFTGLDMYKELRDLLLGSPKERESVHAYEDFLQQHLFDDQEVELTPRRDDDVVYLRLGDADERPIYALGDGVQALIVMTYPAFTAKQRTLFFFEEPDTHLHPGMQRKVLELFLKHPLLRRHQLFVTTHSNHLLDMAADYSGCTTLLFRRGPEPSASFEIRSIGQADRLVLDELGVRASSVFLTNATIWVEGISDRLYIREYLRKFLAENDLADMLREDTHFSFMEGGGANIAHFDFSTESAVTELTEQIRAARICSRSFVILDGDNEGKPRLDDLRATTDGNLFIVTSKEVENLRSGPRFLDHPLR